MSLMHPLKYAIVLKYKHSIQNNFSNPLKMSNEDLQKYIGVLVIMSVVIIKNIRRYWSPILDNRTIENTMTTNTFETNKSQFTF